MRKSAADGLSYLLAMRRQGWVRYFSETIDGDFEEVFRLCPCNHKFDEARGERAGEGVQSRAILVVCSFELKVLKGLVVGAKR